MSDGAFRNFCDFLERVKKTQTRVVPSSFPSLRQKIDISPPRARSFPRAHATPVSTEMPPSSGEEGTGLIYDVVSLKRVGVPFAFPRFFAPDLLARLRKGYNVAWLPARPLAAVLGVGRQAMANG